MAVLTEQDGTRLKWDGREWVIDDGPPPPARDPHRGYLVRLVAMVGVVLVAIGALNVVVDPERVFDLPSTRGLNNHKVRITRAGRAELVRRSGAAVVLVGSSRTARAFPPGHPAWASLARAPGERGRAGPTINAGLGGANIYETRAMALHAMRSDHDLRTLVLFVDFMMFNRAGPLVPGVNEGGGPQQDFLHSRLDPDLSLPDYFFGHALSTHSTELSLFTLEQRREGHTSPVSVTGLRAMGVPKPAFDHREAFDRIADRSLQPGYLYGRFDYAAEGMGMLREVLAEAATRNVRVLVAIPPIHAHQQEVIRAAGLFDTYERWKRELVRAVASAPTSDGAERPVWDFSVYNPWTTEPVPQNAHGRMVNWWESSHSTQAFGAEVIWRLTGQSPRDGEPVDPSIGTPVDASTIEAHLAAQRAARDDWAAAHSDEVRRIGEIAKRARERGWVEGGGRGGVGGRGGLGSV